VTVAFSLVSLVGGFTLAIVICVALLTVTAPNATEAPLGVLTLTAVAGQVLVAFEEVVKFVPVMVTLPEVCPASQTFGDTDEICGSVQVVGTIWAVVLAVSGTLGLLYW
jgi:hypothetical protein